MAKEKSERVVKPLKKEDLKIINDEPVAIKVVDSDGKVIKIFRKAEYGPRYTFKATQFVTNYSTPMNPYHIESI